MTVNWKFLVTNLLHQTRYMGIMRDKDAPSFSDFTDNIVQNLEHSTIECVPILRRKTLVILRHVSFFNNHINYVTGTICSLYQFTCDLDVKRTYNRQPPLSYSLFK